MQVGVVVALIVAFALMLVLIVVLGLAVRSTSRNIEELRAELARNAEEHAQQLDDLRSQTLPLLADTRAALRKADGQNRRADALLDVATSLTGTADAASKFAYRTVTNPFVKAAAFVTGTKRAAQELAAPKAKSETKGKQGASRRLTRQSKRRAISVSSTETKRPRV